MPERTSSRIPKYRLRKPTGRAVVRLNGRDVYLGTHGSDESRRCCRQVIAELLANIPASRTRIHLQRGRV